MRLNPDRFTVSSLLATKAALMAHTAVPQSRRGSRGIDGFWRSCCPSHCFAKAGPVCRHNR